MSSNLSIGQWQVFFTYGPEYGEHIEGQEVEFRLFIESIADGNFTGRSIDWSGIGASGETAVIKGFEENDFINFTKQYDQNFTLGPDGSTYADDSFAPTLVVYEGTYDTQQKVYVGNWEIAVQEMDYGDFSIQQVSTGTWYMKIIS